MVGVATFICSPNLHHELNVASGLARSKYHVAWLHLGHAPALSVSLLPPALRRFQELRPGVKVTLHDLSTEEMLTALIEQRLQVALMIRPSARARRGVRFEELWRYAVCLAANPSHPWVDRHRPSLKDLVEERLIGYRREEYPEYHEWMTALFRTVDAAPRIGEEHDSATSLIASVEAGRGVAIVPESLACLAGLRLTVQPLRGALNRFRVGIGCRAGDPSELVAAFLEAAR
jgi:DNA-binding transcriptional LysR family regulator